MAAAWFSAAVIAVVSDAVAAPATFACFASPGAVCAPFLPGSGARPSYPTTYSLDGARGKKKKTMFSLIF